MLLSVCERISGCLSARSRDITPSGLRHVAKVLYATVSEDIEFNRSCAAVLSTSELDRAERFASPADRSLFLQRRAFRRFCGAQVLGNSQSLSHVDFVETENGRPFLRELPNHWFSFSSWQHGYLGAWSASHALGVDIEDRAVQPGVIEMAGKYYSAAEARLVQGRYGAAKLLSFLKLWTLKEAALKSIGEGLPYGLDAFEFELEPRLQIVRTPAGHGNPQHFEAHLLANAASCCAVVARRRRTSPLIAFDGKVPPFVLR